MTPELEENQQFWRIYLGCAGQWTTVPELVEFYDRDEAIFYRDPGSVAELAENGVLMESRRMKTAYRTDFRHIAEEEVVAGFLDHCSRFFSHEWLRILVPDEDVRAEKAEDIFRTISSNLRASVKDAHRFLAVEDMGGVLREVMSASPEPYYPHYFQRVRLFHLLSRLNGFQIMERVVEGKGFHADGFPDMGAVEAPVPEDGLTEEYISRIVGMLPSEIGEREMIIGQITKYLNREA